MWIRMGDAWGGSAALVKLAMLAYLGAHGEPLQAAHVASAVRAPAVVRAAPATARPVRVAPGRPARERNAPAPDAGASSSALR